jgi:hypothetical protein
MVRVNAVSGISAFRWWFVGHFGQFIMTQQAKEDGLSVKFVRMP